MGGKFFRGSVIGGPCAIDGARGECRKCRCGSQGYNTVPNKFDQFIRLRHIMYQTSLDNITSRRNKSQLFLGRGRSYPSQCAKSQNGRQPYLTTNLLIIENHNNVYIGLETSQSHFTCILSSQSSVIWTKFDGSSCLCKMFFSNCTWFKPPTVIRSPLCVLICVCVNLFRFS